MKKLYVILFAITLLVNLGFAQTTVQKKTNLIDIGFGFGRNLHSYKAAFPAVFSAKYQRGIAKLGPGVLSLGGSLGFGIYGYSGGNTKSLYLAFNAEYHYDWKVNKLDTYAGTLVGGVWNSDSWNDDFYWGAAYGFYAGAAYYFVPKFGVFAEAGYGMTWLTAGVSIKL